jgi:hypothetical protein
MKVMVKTKIDRKSAAANWRRRTGRRLAAAYLQRQKLRMRAENLRSAAIAADSRIMG